MAKILSFILFVIFGHSAISDTEINLSLNKFIQLARHIEVAEPELKYEFSRIALIEMYYAYQDEIKRSLEDKQTDSKKIAKVRHWRYATREYIDGLDQTFFEIDSGSSLDFFITPQNKIVILVSGKPVIISGPNAGGNKQIEKNVVEQFCQSFDCRTYFEPVLVEDKAKETIKKVHQSFDFISGSWSLNEETSADFVTSHGIIYRFKSISQRDLKEQWALAVGNELLVIIEQLKSAKLKNVTIDWSALSLHDLPLTDNSYKLLINNNKEYLKVPVSILGQNKELIILLQGWLQSHFDKELKSRIIIEQADDYFQSFIP